MKDSTYWALLYHRIADQWLSEIEWNADGMADASHPRNAKYERILKRVSTRMWSVSPREGIGC